LLVSAYVACGMGLAWADNKKASNDTLGQIVKDKI
jgi:hypothetical protein